MIDQTIYKLEIGERYQIDKAPEVTQGFWQHEWLRVPGGWVFSEWVDDKVHSCFIPYNEEGKQ